MKCFRQQLGHQDNIFSASDTLLLSSEVSNLLSLGAVSPCSPCPGQFVSRIFLVPKPDGGKRFILNLKPLNKFIETNHFKMEDIRTAVKLLSPNCFMAKIDLKNAYYSIPVSVSDRKLLRFFFQDQLFEFTCIPFGLSSGPLTFTKIMKPVVGYLRSLGLLSCIYLDDLLCVGSSFEECHRNVVLSLETLRCLGFVVNFEKSVLVPSKKCTYLGFTLASDSMSIELPEDKRSRLCSLIDSFLKKEVFIIRDFARLVGSLIAACPAVPYGMLYTKSLEIEKSVALAKNNLNFNGSMRMNSRISSELSWWRSQIPRVKKLISRGPYVLEIFSDASPTGWGACCGRKRANGFWSVSESSSHINLLELQAAFFGLKIFASSFKDSEILLRLDNTTAISYINRFGGTKFDHFNSLARQIWQWCEARNLWIFASYIKSRDNVVADKESRRSATEIEWELADSAFDRILLIFPNPTIDLFASRINNKCDTFISWHRDPDAWAVDAFTVSWTNFLFYAFPPFALILRTLRKIVDDKARGILVAPYWPSQPWFPLMLSMIEGDQFLIFEPDPNLLISSSREPHPLHKSLRLIASVLSGKLL